MFVNQDKVLVSSSGSPFFLLSKSPKKKLVFNFGNLN